MKPKRVDRNIILPLYPAFIAPFDFPRCSSVAPLKLHPDATFTGHPSSSTAPFSFSRRASPSFLLYSSLQNLFHLDMCVDSDGVAPAAPPRSQREKRGGRPRGQMHRAKESRGEMERHLMFSRWGSQECRSNLQERTLTHTVAQLEGEHMGNLCPPKQRKLTQQDIAFCFLCKCHTVFLNK